MSSFFTFNPVTKKQTQVLLNSKSPEVRALLKEIFIKNVKDQEKQEILMDFYFNIYEFTQKCNFSYEKTSTCLGILNHIFNQSIQNNMNLNDSFQLLKEILHVHSIQRPPKKIEIFNERDVKLIQEFCLSGYYRHYSLYVLTFAPIIDVKLITYEPFHKVQLPSIFQIKEGQIADPLQFADLLQSYLPVQVEQAPSEVSEKQEVTAKTEESNVDLKINDKIKLLQEKVQKALQDNDQEFLQKLEQMANEPDSDEEANQT